MLLPRYYDNPEKYLEPGRVLVIYGPRRVGKTTLLKEMLGRTHLRYVLGSGDDVRVRQVLGSQDFSVIGNYVGKNELIVIDEAQRVPEIGMGLKIIVDQYPNVRVVATGSSSFDLVNTIGEPLTGRKRTLNVYPLAQMELKNFLSGAQLGWNLADYLVLGSYPQVLTAKTREDKIIMLEEITHSYLLKDVLEFEHIKSSGLVVNLLKLLAFQVGGEVSLNELATQLRVDVKTVDRYLDLLEKTFVIYRVGGYSRNLRSEITSKQKYYFLDNGVRNAVIGQYNELSSRNDVGQLWENFVFSERIKKASYTNMYGFRYFWRTYSQQEIDLVEERDGKLFGYECKWSSRKEVKPPREWAVNYPDAEFHVITPDNYLDFVA